MSDLPSRDKYCVVDAVGRDRLYATVDIYMAEGWQLQGGVSVYIINGVTHFLQALSRHGEYK